MSSLTRLFNKFSIFKKVALKASIYSVINKLFDIAPEILIGIAIDVVVSHDQSFLYRIGITEVWDQMLVLGGATFLIWLGESVFEYLHLTCWRGLAQDIQHRLRIDTYAHVQSLDMSFFENKSTGNLVSVLNDDINQLERFLDGGANQLIQTFVAVFGVGTVFFIVSPKIALFSFLPIPIIIFGAFLFQRKVEPLYGEVRGKVGILSGRLSNNLSGIMTIKSFNRESFEVDQLTKDSDSYMSSNKNAIRVSSSFIPIIRMAILAGFLVSFLMGAQMVINKELPVGMYGVLVFLTQRLLWPLTGLAATMDLYQRAMASIRRILDLMDAPVTIKSGTNTLQTVAGDLSAKSLSFKYETGGEVLGDISFKVSSGQTLALIGPTGSGKSSLLKLLLRFYEPTKGSILLDGVDIRTLSLNFLREQIGFVSQDVFLFHGTVLENIIYSKPGASFEEVVEAAKMAEAHDFIQALPNAYETTVGERGQKLSGGQRQRLSLARAILRNPKILILDEATSAVDNETEAAIQRSLRKVCKGRTTIIVAHRLSTIVHADQILVLEKSKIVESGDHHQLMKQSGLYKKLWDVQTGNQNL